MRALDRVASLPASPRRPQRCARLTARRRTESEASLRRRTRRTADAGRPPERRPASVAAIALAVIDLAALRRAGSSRPMAGARRSPTSSASSSGRSCAMRRGQGAQISNGHLVMVTSALPGEGKTYTAVNLAMSIAMELDTTVVLVDGDVAHPDFPTMLGVPARRRPARPADQRQARRRRRAGADQHRKPLDPPGRRATSPGPPSCWRAIRWAAAGRTRHPLPRPHHRLRLAAAAAHDRGARARDAHGPDRHGGGGRSDLAAHASTGRWRPSRPAKWS